ncbi:FtsX-like permease family protein [Paraneptunicella aestuarii]|uniref:ABC transporter permease n=1 Tax=Paraneptunicella aestuarii TaxID=2831148 RepID=UPI001E3E54FC|nr:FtsX-like permease family protein [Paraneptunicella aestuarii]UAA37373.1 FtsX-like permease family protein [Paraneptunicella aestuarii]
MWMNLAWRLFKHEARRGELTIILLAIVLSVAAVLSLSLFSERLQSALNDRSAQFIGGDALLKSSHVIDESWLQQAKQQGLETAYQANLTSMAFAKDNMSLIDVRATDSFYPLKGEVKIAEKPFAPGVITHDLPDIGEAWVESQLFKTLNIDLGDELEIGDLVVRVTKVLVEVPDGGFSVFAINPKVLIRVEDLAKAHITGPGSRVVHKYYFAGSSDSISAYSEWLEPKLIYDLNDWQSIEDDESGMGESVAKAEQFFLLASLLAIVLASVAIAVAAQRYSHRHYDPVAIMKTLGASKQLVQRVYLLQVFFVTMLGIVIGSVLGFIAQQIVVWAIADQIPVAAQSWYWGPVGIAVFTGFVCAILFSVYPLLKLFSVPPLRVLRKDLGARLSSRFLQFIAAAVGILLLMWVYSGNLEMSLILFVSGVVLVIALMLVTFALIWVGRRLGQGRMGAWQLAWARIQRRAMDNSVQLISFAITIMLLLMVLVMRNDMVQQWRAQLPEGTPNYFMININQEQVPEMEQRFSAQGLKIEEFYPVVRGRFVSVNGERVRTSVAKNEEDEQAQRDGLGREANLTWSTRLQHENEIIEGEWLTEWQEGQPLPVSVEKDASERMKIKLGDVLGFNIGSEVVEVTVTSIRQVNWQTMQPNFFFVMHPKTMENFKPTYITSFNIPKEKKSLVPELMAPFGTVSLIDVDARIDQLREIIDQVSMAIEFILVLVLVAGSLVLVAQVQASMDERQQELAILRTLGAKGSLIRASVVFEFIILGVVAGLMAAMANEISLYFLQSGLFQMAPMIHFEYWILAPLAGAGVVGLLGALSCWRLLSLNTTTLLRQMV